MKIRFTAPGAEPVELPAVMVDDAPIVDLMAFKTETGIGPKAFKRMDDEDEQWLIAPAVAWFSLRAAGVPWAWTDLLQLKLSAFDMLEEPGDAPPQPDDAPAAAVEAPSGPPAAAPPGSGRGDEQPTPAPAKAPRAPRGRSKTSKRASSSTS